MDISKACQAFEAKEAAPTIAGSSPFAAPVFVFFVLLLNTLYYNSGSSAGTSF